MQRQTGAAQVAAKATGDPFRQRRDDHLAFGRQPTLAAVVHKFGRQHQIAHEEALVAFEPRTFRRIDPQCHGAGDPAPVTLGAAWRFASRTIAVTGLCRLLHARRSKRRTRRQALQAGNLVAQLLVLSLETGIVEPKLGIVFPQGFILGSQRYDLCLERVQFLDKATDETAQRHKR